MSDAKDDDFWRQRPGYRVQRLDYLPRPISATLRGSRSGRDISVGDAVRAEDGDLPSCSVVFADDPPEPADRGVLPRPLVYEAALAEALFGWLP